jgi:hypothetical protein
MPHKLYTIEVNLEGMFILANGKRTSIPLKLQRWLKHIMKVLDETEE